MTSMEEDAAKDPNFVIELAELTAIVEDVVRDTSLARSKVSAFKLILLEYQEQPQLLDPHLEALVKPLTEIVANAATEGDDSFFVSTMQVCRLLYLLINTRGYKTISRFFPNKAADMERPLMLLGKVGAFATSHAIDEDEQDGSWQTSCVLLLWLSALVILPFDMSTIKVAESIFETDKSSNTPDSVQWMISLTKHFLRDPGPPRDMAAVLLSKLLIREDMASNLEDFLQWCWKQLEEFPEQDATTRAFLLPGILFTLSCLFKTGRRSLLLGVTPIVWTHMASLIESDTIDNNSLARKLTMKVLQRCALTVLDPTCVNALVAAVRASKRHGHQEVPTTDDEVLALTADGSRMLAAAIDALLSGLRDKDTIVRWSAAKGLGRIAIRLPAVCVDDINDAVLELFSPLESDSAWQGACLATAELVRHGLLPTHRLPQAVPAICQALHYEERRGPHSIGGHVRDAASYVCWAFARAYKAEAMADFINILTPPLLAASCYDREVNCRRAAAAAFQESVGRLGASSFPNGIEILTTADYFTLGSRTQSYLTIGPTIASLPQYTVPLANHLLSVKLENWDLSVRQLAAQALAALVPLQPGFFADSALTQVLPRCTNRHSLERRHGAVLAVSEIVGALHAAQHETQASTHQRCVDTVLAVQRENLCKGKGGELMRCALCDLIITLSRIGVPLSGEQVVEILAIIDDNLIHSEQSIQAAGGKCLQEFLGRYGGPENTADLARYCSGLFDHMMKIRTGSGIALAALPRRVLCCSLLDTIKAVCRSSNVNTLVDTKDADSRVKGIAAMVAIVTEVYGGSQGEADVEPEIELKEACLTHVLPALFLAMEDYTVDNRGDVGSWVREAAMEAFVSVYTILLRQHVLPDAEMIEILTRTAATFLRQSMERIARVREAAATALLSLVKTVEELQPGARIPGHADLLVLLSVEEAPGCFGNASKLPSLAVFMSWPVYSESIMDALIASIGGIDSSLSELCAGALACLLKSPSHMAAHLTHTASAGPAEQVHLIDSSAVCQLLLSAWTRHGRSIRMATPLLKMLDCLWSRAVIGVDTVQDQLLEKLLVFVKDEFRGCNDMQRLISIGTALCHIGSSNGAATKDALQAAMVMLGSKFPNIRRHTAERLYVVGVMLQSRMTGATNALFWDKGKATVMCDILSVTVWDAADIEVAKDARARLINLLGLTPPKVKALSANKQGAKKSKYGGACDENASYQALVDDVARGF